MEQAKCPNCGVHPFQHGVGGYTHTCHVCGKTWKSDKPQC